MKELLYSLRNNQYLKILNIDDTVTKRLPDKPNKELVNILNIEPFKNFKKELMTTICAHKGNELFTAISNNLWIKIKEKQRELIVAKMNQVIKDEDTNPSKLEFSNEIIRDLIRSTNIPFENLSIDEGDFREISRTIKHLFYSAFNRTDGSKSDFLYVYLGLNSEEDEPLKECFAKTGEFLRDALVEMRDAQLKKEFFTLPYKSSIDWEKPQNIWYVTHFPHNYTLPEITNQVELLAALKLAQRSLIRYYKSLDGNFFKPNARVKLLNKHHLPAKQEPKKAIEGDEHCYTFELLRIGQTTIVFKMSSYGVINPYMQAFGSYETLKIRLENIKKDLLPYLPGISDPKLANWIIQLAALNADDIRAAGVPARKIDPIIQRIFDIA